MHVGRRLLAGAILFVTCAASAIAGERWHSDTHFLSAEMPDGWEPLSREEISELLTDGDASIYLGGFAAEPTGNEAGGPILLITFLSWPEIGVPSSPSHLELPELVRDRLAEYLEQTLPGGSGTPDVRYDSSRHQYRSVDGFRWEDGDPGRATTFYRAVRDGVVEFQVLCDARSYERRQAEIDSIGTSIAPDEGHAYQPRIGSRRANVVPAPGTPRGRSNPFGDDGDQLPMPVLQAMLVVSIIVLAVLSFVAVRIFRR